VISNAMSTFRIALAQFCIVAVSCVLLGAFSVQFLQSELPCPLCILQRMGMMLCAAGPAWLICRARTREVSARDYAECYGVSILAAILGGAVSLRQVCLHIAPGDPGFGEPVFGLHLYTWAFVVFLTVVAVSAVQLLLLPRAPERIRIGFMPRACVGLLVCIVAANALAVFVEEGFHWYLPDNPTSYQLFQDLHLTAANAPSTP
jgi:disulfide bond formation protein DsbB